MQQRTESGHSDIRAIRQSYRNAVAGAEAIWEQAQAEGGPDPELATGLVVEGLASAVGQNRRAMLALTALCRYDNYTFTHMVNVSVLTMAQARSLGIDGRVAAPVRAGRPDARHRQDQDAAPRSSRNPIA